MTKDGQPFFTVGSPGGASIITTVLQTIVNRIDLRVPLPDALALPRDTATTQAHRRRRVALARARIAIACGSVIPWSSRSTRIWSTVVMIVEPPGEPSARNGLPLRRTIVGDIELRGRLPPSTRLGWVVES